ncbi:hypothetical protein PF672P1_00067 [Parabacteroides phage PF672P1]|nr:hypothetical protein PF672P1_00067 [Parabacteroides phage PF672P1]
MAKAKFFKVGAFKCSLTKFDIRFSSANDEWRMAFKAGTREYYIASGLLAEEKNDILEIIIRAMYYSRLVFQDVKLLKEWEESVNNFVKRKQEKNNSEVSEKEDAVILAKERFIHEKDEDSYNAMKSIEKDKENEKK